MSYYNSTMVSDTAKTYHEFACSKCEKELKEAGYAIKKLRGGFYVAGERTIKAVGHNTKGTLVRIDFMDKADGRFDTYFYINPSNHDMKMFIDKDGFFRLADNISSEKRVANSSSQNELRNIDFKGVWSSVDELKREGLIINI